MSAVVIVDCGGANLASLQYALERLGARPRLSRDAHVIADASHVLLPGVGAAADAMRRLAQAGLTATLKSLTQPVLGICLGMQLLCAHSEEGPTDCLGVLPQHVHRLSPAPGRPVPHMGWNQLHEARADALLEGIAARSWVYFVHSFAAPPSAQTLASVSYGAPLAAVMRRDNFYGTQFHPERSGRTGSRLLANFLRL
jgi:imidazole glycerol-phosphate synthase subunit HisH